MQGRAECLFCLRLPLIIADRMPDQLELDWLLLGLRLGQLTDVVRPVYLRDDDDPPLVVQLVSKLRSALRRCVTVPKDQERLLRIASQMEATWEQRDAPVLEHGTENHSS